ncbi:uncharacterized protein LOC117295804 [Asterias rubens]|uniref:uncharacterized protein LOC117295804 n=1 Tax=Asterias rubens TaxID=7604 RepID=UPI0014550B68|nr:uncharacterized protein LOC117295804 [Asterias rubens]
MGRITTITSTGLPLVLCFIMMAFLRVDCCRTGINRATDEAAHKAEVARREAQHLGHVLRESVEILRSDMETALHDIDQQVGQVGRYVTQELGPTIEDAANKFNENSQDVIFRIESSLNNLDSAIDMTASKASMLFDLLIVLVLLVIGAFCRKICIGDRFLRIVFWLSETASLSTAVAMAGPVIFRIVTGHEPANYQMLNTVVFISLVRIIVHVSLPLLPVLYMFCKEWVSVVNIIRSLFLMLSVWLVGSALTSGNIITISLLGCSVVLLVALQLQVHDPAACLYAWVLSRLVHLSSYNPKEWQRKMR